MKKSFLPLLALVAMASCTQNDMDQKAFSDEGTPILLGANALSVEAQTRTPFEGTIGSSNQLTALVLASATTNNYTTQYATGGMLFADETTPVGYITATSPAPVVPFSGKAYYPADGSKLYFAALYPATGWAASITTDASFTFTGKEDVMAAGQVSGDKTAHPATTSPSVTPTTIPAFAFKHLLTKLNLKFKAEDAAAIAAWGNVNKIEMIKAGGNVNMNTKVTVTLATGAAVTPTAFALPTNAFKCWILTATADAIPVKTYTDTEYTAQTYALTTTAAYQAYTLVAPIVADGTADYTFRIWADGAENHTVAPTGKYIDVDVNLRKTVSGTETLFTSDTQGKSFDITLTFKAKTITATAAVSAWNTDNEANDDTVIE